MDPLKRTASEMSVEETQDPPSFTRKILREELNVSEKEVDKYLKILAIKAAKIQRKLSTSTSLGGIEETTSNQDSHEMLLLKEKNSIDE